MRQYTVFDKLSRREITFDWHEDRDPDDLDMQEVFTQAAKEDPKSPTLDALAARTRKEAGLPEMGGFAPRAPVQESTRVDRSYADVQRARIQREEQAKADVAKGEEYLAQKKGRFMEPYTPERFAEENTGIERGFMGDVGDVMSGTVHNLTGRITAPLRGESYTEGLGRRTRETEQALLQKRAVAEARARQEKGLPLSEVESETLAGDKGFLAELAEFGKMAVTQPDELVKEVGIQILEDAPSLLLTTKGAGALLNAARRVKAAQQAAGTVKAAGQRGMSEESIARLERMLKTRQAAGKADKALQKQGFKSRLKEEVAEDVLGSAAVSMPQAHAQGGEYGAGEALLDLAAGSVLGAAGAGLGAHFDPRMKPEDYQQVKRVTYTAGLDELPQVESMLPHLKAAGENPNLRDARFQADPKGGAEYWDRARLDAVGYQDRPEGFYSAAGKTQKGLVTLGREAGPETVTEEAAHLLQSKLRQMAAAEDESGPAKRLLRDITSWENAVRRDAQGPVPGGDELFGQAFTAAQGFADKLPKQAFSVPEPILAGFRKLLGDRPELRGGAIPEGAVEPNVLSLNPQHQQRRRTEAERFLASQLKREPEPQEVYQYLRSLQEDEAIPAPPEKPKRIGQPIAQQEARSAENDFIREVLEAGAPEVQTVAVAAKDLPDRFTVAGTEMRRVKTQFQGIVRVKDARGKTFDIPEGAQAHMDDTQAAGPGRLGPDPAAPDPVSPLPDPMPPAPRPDQEPTLREDGILVGADGEELFQLKKKPQFDPPETAGLPETQKGDPKLQEIAAKEWKAKGTDSQFFKRWFGKSQVKDAKGKPLRVYHGGSKGVEIFDYSKIGSHGRAEGPGFYFTDDHNTAKTYAAKGGELYETYLSLQKPLHYDAKPFPKAKLKAILLETARREVEGDGVELADSFLSNFGDVRYEGLNRVLDEALSQLEGEASALDQISGLVGSGTKAEWVNRAVQKVTGYDGVIAEGFGNQGRGGGRLYVAFFPEQIKSATGNRGTFDPQDPDIRYQLKPAEGPKADAIRTLYRAALSDPKTPHKVIPLQRVDKAESERFKAKTGFDLEGFDHVITTDAIRHIIKNHGDEATELKRGQVAITEEDVARIPEIIRDYDKIEAAGENGLGLQTIRYVKRMGGNYVFLEEIREGRRHLAAKSLWKERAPGANDMSPLTATPSHTPQTLPGAPMDNLGQKNPPVNPPQYQLQPAEDGEALRKGPEMEAFRKPDLRILPQEAQASAGGAGGGRPPEPPLDEPGNPDVPHGVGRRQASLRRAEAEALAFPARLEREAVQTWESLDEPVRKILREYDDDKFYSILKDRTLTSAETQAWDARVRGKRESLEDLKKEAEKNPALKGPLLAAQLEYIAAEKAMVNDGTAVARALNARRRIMLGAGKDSDQALIRKISREIPNVTNRDIAHLLETYRKNPEAFGDVLRQSLSHGKADKALELWKAGLLSSFSTDVANVAGNALEQATRTVEAAVSGGVDWLIQKTKGGERARYVRDAAAEISGTAQAFPGALRAFARNAKDVVTLKDKPIDMAQKFEHQTGAVGGVVGKVARTSFRKMEAEDQFFKDLIGPAELRKQAQRLALKEGKSGAALSERIHEIEREVRQQPEKHTAIIRAVQDAQQERTFQGNPGSLANGLLRLREQHKALQVVLPFIKTPANILSVTVERSPAGYLKAAKAYRAYHDAARKATPKAEVQRLRGKASDAIGRATLGTAMLGGFAAMAKAGLMTGGGPADQKEKNLQRETGWQPYSFVVEIDGKKRYIPFNRFEPVSSLLGIAADLAEAKDDKTAENLFERALGSVASNLLSKTYLQGLADAAEFVNDPKRFAGQYTSNLAGTMVPNIVARGARAADPVLRDVSPEDKGLAGVPERMGKTIQSHIPGLSQKLPARFTATGEPIERPGTWAERFASPISMSTEKEGQEVERELSAIGYAPGAPSREIEISGEKVRLSEEEYASLIAARKKAAARFQKTMGQPGYKKLNSEQRKRMARQIFETETDIARDTLKRALKKRQESLVGG